VLDKQGLPRELAALPHVESSFDPTAYSKVGAAGLWQFTRSTGVRYMQIDHVVDERRDPFLATEAAARLLADNYSVLGSWPLALTAYNHGLAGMRRAVQQQNTTDIDKIVARYQSRSFQFASRNFYTAFLAALEIDSNPEQFFPNLRVNAPSDTTVVLVPSFITSSTLAHSLNVRESVLRELNPALMDTIWSGDKLVPKDFPLRVPRSTAAVAEELLAAIDSSERFASQRLDKQHRVRRGDTLSEIATEYHVSLAALMRLNGLTGRDLIRVGQLINLPVDARGGAVPAAALAAAEPEEPVHVVPAVASAETGAVTGSYTVRRGDSIDRIARQLGVDTGALIAANALGNPRLIYPGQTLRVPGAIDDAPVVVLASSVEPQLAAAVLDRPTLSGTPDSLTSGTDALTDDMPEEVEAEALEAALTPAVLGNGDSALSAAETPANLDDDADDAGPAIEQVDLAADPSDYSVAADDRIEVQALETLGHYADWLDLPTQRLRDLNGLKFRESVAIGQKLKLDFSRVDQATFEQRRVAYQQQRQNEFFATHQIEDTESHVIKSGESLWILAAHKYKVPVWLLRQYNPDLDLDRVQPGTIVKFPRLRVIDATDAAAPAVQRVLPQTVAETDH
jgi:peptidoglycan lytic transglycosylase D